MPDGQERLIKFSITRRDPYIAIICENSNPGGIVTGSNEKEGDRIFTSKTESGHGYGLRTIERIATSYGGMMYVSFDQEMFTITVALKDN